MCNEIKCAVQENVQIGCTGNVHIAAVWMMGNNGCDYSLLNWVLWMLCCYETEFRSLMAWGKKLLRSLSVLANMIKNITECVRMTSALFTTENKPKQL